MEGDDLVCDGWRLRVTDTTATFSCADYSEIVGIAAMDRTAAAYGLPAVDEVEGG